LHARASEQSAIERSPRDEPPASTKESPPFEHNTAPLESVVPESADPLPVQKGKPSSGSLDKSKKRRGGRSRKAKKAASSHAAGVHSSAGGSTDTVSADEETVTSTPKENTPSAKESEKESNLARSDQVSTVVCSLLDERS
jgi:hypothetical protein